MKIRKYKQSDLEQCADLVTTTFLEYNQKGENPNSIKEFLHHFDIKNNKKEIKNNFSKSKIKFVAIEKNKIVGIIRGREDRISTFFVDKNHIGKGIVRD